MCIIRSTARIDVRSTRIFARPLAGRQLLVYQMHLDTAAPSAMILPIPIAAGAGEDAVVFRDLSALRDLFAGLALLFPSPDSGRILALGPRPAALKVHQVGSFEASFAPTRADLDRLDPRFRLPDAVWRDLPAYDDWGFVVFQFRPGAHEIHPMAFEFPSRFPDWLFFPTVHVHDGELHPTADFDHQLYCQGLLRAAYRDIVFGTGLPDVHAPLYAGETGEMGPLQHIRRPTPLTDVLDFDGTLLRLSLRGQLPNEDTWLHEPA